MVVYSLPAVEAGCTGFVDYLLKISVVGISKHPGKIAARPVLVARVAGTADLLKRRGVTFGCVVSDHFRFDGFGHDCLQLLGWYGFSDGAHLTGGCPGFTSSAW